MANEEILGGLKSALTRGYSLKDAMISFYNAGYKKEDIEDAARELQHGSPQTSEAAKPAGPEKGKLPVAPYKPVEVKQPVAAKAQEVETKKPAVKAPVVEVKQPTVKPREVATKPIAKAPEVKEQPTVKTTQPVQIAPSEEKETRSITELPILKKEEKEETAKPVQHFKALHPQKVPAKKEEKEVSAYRPSNGIRVVTIVLIVLLVVLLSMLGAVFIFKSQIIQFFNNLLTA